MYKTLFIFILLIFSIKLNAQNNKAPLVQPVGNLSLDSNISWLSHTFDQKIKEEIRIIGLGEVTHGGHEPFIAKSKIVQYLIESKGFKTLIIEHNDISIRPLNHYLNDQSPLNKTLIDSMVTNSFKYTAYLNEEVITLINWLKKYNLSHSEKISIRGMDIDIHPRSQYFINNTLLFLDTASTVKMVEDWNKKKATDSIVFHDIYNWVNQNKEKIKIKLNSIEYESLITDLENVKASYTYTKLGKGNNEYSFEYRDSLMAENVKKISLNKAIIWAHNLHIAITTNNTKLERKNLGFNLDKFYGTTYYKIITDYTQRANIQVLQDDVNNIGESYFKHKSYPCQIPSTAYQVKKKFGIYEGVLFKDDLINAELPFTYNSLGLRAEFQTRTGDSSCFDAIILFKNITPSKIKIK